MKICIDPGHNHDGADTGASGNGLFEQDLTLDIARRLKPLLEYNGLETVMTRDGNYVNGPHNTLEESLSNRCNIANNAGADLFVSIHINSFPDPSAHGAQTFIIATGGRAEQLANKVQSHLAECGLYNRGVSSANFEVLRDTLMPAILTENGFISNTDDAARLGSPLFLQALAVAHAKGICEYCGVQYKEGVTIQPVTQANNDPDVYLSVRVRTSKADALVQQIISLGYACAKLPLA